MNKKPASSRKPGAPAGARTLIFSVAITGTLALWALFSKIERDPTAAVEPAAIATAAPSEVVTGEVVLNLPPIPTLIPAASVAGTAAAAPGAILTTDPVAPPVPSFVQPVKIIARDGNTRPDRPARSPNRSGGGGGGSTGSSR